MYSPFNAAIAQSTIELSFVKINHLYNDSLCEKFFVQITIKLKVLMDGITKSCYKDNILSITSLSSLLTSMFSEDTTSSSITTSSNVYTFESVVSESRN